MASQDFDIVRTYQNLLSNDADLTMPIAAIEALTHGLAHLQPSTVAELLDLVSRLTAQLKAGVPNWISLSAGTDLFQQYLITNLQKPSASVDFEQIRTHLVQNGELFVERAKAARQTIAAYGKQFVQDGNVILTNGGSRVVASLLQSAAESRSDVVGASKRFKVIYVASHEHDGKSEEFVTSLRDHGIPVATIPPTAVAYSMHHVTQCFVGAEGVVENGGIVSRLGTFQIGMLAKAANKPFFVVSESHKFVRLHPLDQDDLGIEQRIVNFETSGGKTHDDFLQDEGVADVGEHEIERSGSVKTDGRDAVDYTPPNLITGIITDTGILLPSAVSEELIKIWF